MKKLLLTLVGLIYFQLTEAQITGCNLDFSSINGTPDYYSMPHHDVIWIGVQGKDTAGNFNSLFYVRSIDEGASWTVSFLPDPNDHGFAGIFALDENTAWAAMSDNAGIDGATIWKTTNGGMNWVPKTTNEYVGESLRFVCFNSSDSGVAVADSAGIKFEIRTTKDGGSSWSRINESIFPSTMTGEIGSSNSYALVGDNVWFPTNKGRVFYSNDGGRTWDVSTVDSSYGKTEVRMTSASRGIAYASGGTNEVYSTTDGGQTWTLVSLNPPINLTTASQIKNVTGSFVFRSGKDFYATIDNFTTYFPVDISHRFPVQTTLAMYSASIGWMTDTLYSDSIIYKVEDGLNKIEDINSNIKSIGVFPNPVTDNALASFTLDKASAVNVSLMDLQGKIIRRETIEGVKGENVFRLDCRNLSSGIYFMIIQDGESRATLKINVAK